MRTWPALDVGRTDDLMAAALTDFDVAAIEELPDALRVFFPSTTARDLAAHALGKQFPGMALSTIDVPDEDWAARSQASLKAVTVGAVTVAPPWDVPEKPKAQSPKPKTQALTIIIQPSMGFGTGHHATTRLCLAALQRMDLRGRSVIDVGTGSGVLAIAASLLGAATVTALDDDPDAIQSAQENLGLNPAARVTLATIDLRSGGQAPADVVLANLTGGLLSAASQILQSLVRPGGNLVMSGLMESEEDEVLLRFDGYEITQRTQEDEWLCVTLHHKAIFG